MGGRTLSLKHEIPWSVTLNKESMSLVMNLHVLGDASIVARCAVLYVIVHQPSVTIQGLVVCKSPISKRNLTIPRLELVSAHMASNSIENISSIEALEYKINHCVGR